MAGLFDYEFQLDKIKEHQPPLQKLDKLLTGNCLESLLRKH